MQEKLPEQGSDKEVVDIPSLLLPREQYFEESKKYTGSFSTFEIVDGEKVLYYFGANHSPDIDNPQYPALREYWEKFLESTKGKDRIVLIEGGLRRIAEDEITAIKRSSEGGFVTFLSHKDNVPIASPDIKDSELVSKLPDMDREEVLLYWFLSYVDNYQRIPEPRPDFNEDFNNWSESKKKRELWKDVNISLQYLMDLYKKVMGKDFNESESQNNFVNPNRTGTKTNEIARKQSDLRDANIVSEIERYWNEEKSIFVVFGRGHLIIERPALEKLIAPSPQSLSA